ncbi:MAG: DUF3987 domain-containing protein [Candidatus Hodarchaeales archaeon]
MSNQVLDFYEFPPDVRTPDIKLIDVCPILADIVSFFEKWSPESYEGYYLACALGLVSMISARRVEYSFGDRRATNLYILLVDSSGMSAKTTVMKLVRTVFKTVDLDFFLLPDTITAQKLFSSMCIKVPEDFDKKSNEEQKKITKAFQKKLAFVGQRGWIYDEFGKLIREMMQANHHNASFRELLKRLFDNNSELSNSTQIRDDEKIFIPFLSLLGGMTPDDLASHAKKGSVLWGDGFFSRIAFICPPDNFRKDKRFPKGERSIPESITTKLKKWHNRLGVPQIRLSPEIVVLPAPGQLFAIPDEVEDAVYAYRYALKDFIESSENKDLKGHYLRYPEMALRIAVLIASLNNDSKVTLEYWYFAQNITENWRRDLHRLYYQSLSKNNSANFNSIKDPLERVFEVIKTKGPLTSREIQQATHYKKNTRRVLLEALEKEGKIKISNSGKTVVYEAKNDNSDV